MAKPTAIALVATPQLVAPQAPAVSDREIATARGYVEASRAVSTGAHDGDWRRFSSWCQERGTPACLPAPNLSPFTSLRWPRPAMCPLRDWRDKPLES